MGAAPSSLPGAEQPVSRLTDLPAEILQQILECLIPDYPEVGDTRPVTYDKLVPGETWYDITRSQRALRSLCLTSRGLCTMAQPLLYRVIMILDEEGMLLLFRTLTENPALGELARYLSCHLTLTRLNVVREMKKALTRLVRTFRPDLSMLSERYPAVQRAVQVLVLALPTLSTYHGDFDDVPQILLFYIASFMAKVETFMLQVPICDDHPEYTALFEKFASSSLSFARIGGGPGSMPIVIVENIRLAEPPLQHVKTLLLQGDPELLTHFESGACDCDIPEIWGVQARRYWPLYNALSSLTTLEISTDDGIWNNIRNHRPDGTQPPYLERIKHLYLHSSASSPRDLHHLLINAPDLVTLYMTPRRDPEMDIDPEVEGMDEHPESLDEALKKRPGQLRHLDIGWYDCSGNEVLIGPEGRLASLPQLFGLEKLCIQLAVMYGTEPATLHTPIIDLLPPALVELTLEEWWWENIDIYDELHKWTPAQRVAHYRSKSEYRTQALVILSSFANHCRDRMPRLRKVTFQTKFLWTWKMEGHASTESHFGELKDLFAKKGIVFEVEEDESGAFEDSVN
ncbi:hypothetical protein BR93DRAFT_886944 [Coniochaeta sp. PMI_546]|nr:hypothetical protein BR93DRAFT_886944 [Coniochaeta sp. PMI_546]